MNSIVIETDQETQQAYAAFTDDRKQKFEADVQRMLQKYVRAERTARLKKLICELQAETGGEELSVDVLLALVQCD